MLLICQCGQKLNTPGAIPGRVGKCPRCGSMLRIAAGVAPPSPAVAPAEPTPPREPSSAPAEGGTYRPSNRVARRSSAVKVRWADGLVAVPATPEKSFLVCVAYPLRNAAGMALMGFIPPLLWFGCVPLFALVPMVLSGTVVSLFGSLLLLPQLVILFFALGHTLLFLGDVVVTSGLGEVTQPRPAGWNPGEIGRAWVLWAWALLIGGVAGGGPALVYWLRCGDVDWFDQVVLIELILPGLAYAQMALVVALTTDSPWSAANPFRVAGLIWRSGWGYFWPCLVTGSCLAAVAGLLKGSLKIGNGFLQAVAFWAWWVVSLYLAMVALRWLGLFCYRSRVVAIGPKRRRG